MARDFRPQTDSEMLLLHDWGRIVGLAHMYHGKWNSVINMLEIAPEERGRGLGGQLFHAVFARAADKSGVLVMTPYTGLGRAHLLPLEEKLRRQFPKLEIAHPQWC